MFYQNISYTTCSWIVHAYDVSHLFYLLSSHIQLIWLPVTENHYEEVTIANFVDQYCACFDLPHTVIAIVVLLVLQCCCNDCNSEYDLTWSPSEIELGNLSWMETPPRNITLSRNAPPSCNWEIHTSSSNHTNLLQLHWKLDLSRSIMSLQLSLESLTATSFALSTKKVIVPNFLYASLVSNCN